MKKFLIVLVVLCLICIPVFGESFNFESMTLEELLNLRVLLNQEINKRGEELCITLFEGTYTVGIDIQAGAYLIYDDDPERHFTILVSYQGDSDKASFGGMVNPGSPYYLRLEDGAIFETMNLKSAHMIPVDSLESIQ